MKYIQEVSMEVVADGKNLSDVSTISHAMLLILVTCLSLSVELTVEIHVSFKVIWSISYGLNTSIFVKDYPRTFSFIVLKMVKSSMKLPNSWRDQ